MIRKAVILAVLLVFVMSGSALAEGKITTVQKNLYVFDGDDTGYFFAKIENTGDTAIGVDSGKLVAFSADDDIVLSENYILASPSSLTLKPGEYAYVSEFLWDSALQEYEIADYKFSMGSTAYGDQYETTPCEVTYDLNGAESYDNYVYVTFTNTTDALHFGYYVVVALMDAGGNLLYVDANDNGYIGLHPGSTVTIKVYVDSDLIQYYEDHGLQVTSADAMVYYAVE
jgi:hypothetical protein